MANYFQLPEGVRVAGARPIDGDRYIASSILERDSLIFPQMRAFEGLQVYVSGGTESGLYLLTTLVEWNISSSIWTKVNNSLSDILSNPTEIIFNSGGTLTGNSNLTYDYDNSIFKISGIKSNFSIRNSNSYDPTIVLNSNHFDGIEMNIASNFTPIGGIFASSKSFGVMSARTNISSTNLFKYVHTGYYSGDQRAVDIDIDAIEWSSNSHTSTYKISTVSSGNTNVNERFKINTDGSIRFNDAYNFPQISGETGQILTQSGNGNLYWNDFTNSLSGLSDTTINIPQDGDKLIYSGGTWVNVVDADTIYTENIGSGGTYTFIIGDKDDYNAVFIHFMNKQNSTVFQMGELQLLHNGVDEAQVTTNGQDLDLYVQYTSQINGNNIELICEVPNVSGDVIMKYTKEIF